jgi:LSD1 subclass zinc finger protein
MLGEEDAAWLIAELNVGGEYIKAETIENTEARNCGGCGGQLTVLPGAKTIVCDHCGRSLDVGGAQVSCRSCGGTMSLPVGVQRQNCPYCKAEVERVGWT